MSDNVSISSGSGTSIATDDIGGVQYQRTKLTWGVDGSAVDTSATNPLPVVMPTTTSHHFVLAATTNAASVKAAPGTFKQLTGFNFANYAVKVCLHNTAGTPTAGAGVIWAQVVQAGSPCNIPIAGNGIGFTIGIARTVVKVASSADIADAAATATAANDGHFEIGFV